MGSSFYVWEENLRGLKRALKIWAKSIKYPTAKRKYDKEALEIHQLDMEDVVVTQELWNQEVDLQNSLHQPCNEEEEYWRQNSIILWLLAGYKNMSFFHKQAETHEHFKAVNEIQYQGQETKEFEGIKKVSHYLFKDLYTVPDEVPIDSYSYPLSLVPPLVQNEDNMSLTAPILMQELKNSLDHMEDEKTPGPDGFMTQFYKPC